MRGSLSVRVNDGLTDRIVTSKTKGLRFRKTAPGGHADASCKLTLPRETFTDLGPNDRLYIYDSRTARTVWEGYTENPGSTDGTTGQGFELAALGGMVLASDRSEKCVYVDQDLGQWAESSSPTVASMGVDSEINSVDGLLCSLNPGSPVSNGWHAGAVYTGFRGTTQNLARYTYTWVGGKTDANYLLRDGSGFDSTGSGNTSGVTFQTSTGITTAGGNVSKTTADFGTGQNYALLQIARTGGATNIADNTSWVKFTAVTVYARLLNSDGSTASDTATVNASTIAADVIGRLLGQVDPARVTIDTSTTQTIDQLAYHDGANAQQILDDLALYEPDFYWGIGTSGSNGKHEFWFRAWSTSPRYEISTKDGYTAPGGEVDLCNRIVVFWTDTKGVQRTTMVGQEVPSLGTGSPVNSDGTTNTSFTGRIRDAEPITLPDGRGSTANAKRAGQMVLASKASPPISATAVIGRPILDLNTGRMVMPWEIEPGYPVRVRETGDILRLTEMEYDDDTVSTTLTLGTPQRTEEQLIADATRSA